MSVLSLIEWFITCFSISPHIFATFLDRFFCFVSVNIVFLLFFLSSHLFLLVFFFSILFRFFSFDLYFRAFRAHFRWFFVFFISLLFLNRSFLELAVSFFFRFSHVSFPVSSMDIIFFL